MGKSSAAANVIDLEAFRQRKAMREERAGEAAGTLAAEAAPGFEPGFVRHAAMLIPVWYCWVPVWAPVG
jgi:hypothetical protein